MLFFVICPLSLLALKILFLFLIFYSLILGKFLGIDFSVLECSVIQSVLENSHPFSHQGLHVLIDSVLLFTTYIWSLLGKAMTCLQIGRRICTIGSSLLWSGPASLPSSSEAFWGSGRHLILVSCGMSAPELSFFQRFYADPHAVHTDTADFATVLSHLQLCLNVLEPSFQVQGCYHKHEFQAFRLAIETGPTHGDHVPAASHHMVREVVP